MHACMHACIHSIHAYKFTDIHAFVCIHTHLDSGLISKARYVAVKDSTTYTMTRNRDDVPSRIYIYIYIHTYIHRTTYTYAIYTPEQRVDLKSQVRGSKDRTTYTTTRDREGIVTTSSGMACV